MLGYLKRVFWEEGCFASCIYAIVPSEVVHIKFVVILISKMISSDILAFAPVQHYPDAGQPPFHLLLENGQKFLAFYFSVLLENSRYGLKSSQIFIRSSLAE